MITREKFEAVVKAAHDELLKCHEIVENIDHMLPKGKLTPLRDAELDKIKERVKSILNVMYPVADMVTLYHPELIIPFRAGEKLLNGRCSKFQIRKG